MKRPNKAIQALKERPFNSTYKYTGEIEQVIKWLEFVEDNYLCRCNSYGFKIEIDKNT